MEIKFDLEMVSHLPVSYISVRRYLLDIFTVCTSKNKRRWLMWYYEKQIHTQETLIFFFIQVDYYCWWRHHCVTISIKVLILLYFSYNWYCLFLTSLCALFWSAQTRNYFDIAFNKTMNKLLWDMQEYPLQCPCLILNHLNIREMCSALENR